MKEKLNYRSYLKTALEIRQAKNPAYTIGSFGRMLGIETSRMAQILKGKVGISVKRAIKIAEKLNFSDYDKNNFILLVQSEHERNPQKRQEALSKLHDLKNDFDDISDIFHSICDWYCHAIVEMIGLESNLTEEKIAAKLGIKPDLLKRTLTLLLNLKLIEKIPNTTPVRYRELKNTRRTKQDVASEAVKILNEQILEKAKVEIRQQEIQNRDYSVTFLKFNKNQLELAKERIKDFRREFLRESELSNDKDSVYCLSIQFFELSGKEK